jgi:hypothetical protein
MLPHGQVLLGDVAVRLNSYLEQLISADLSTNAWQTLKDSALLALKAPV